MNNPLLDTTGLPLFDQITPDHVAPAMDVLLAEADAALARVTAEDFPADWKAIAQVLDVATERLGKSWGAVSHLNSVADTPELRAAYNAALPRVTEFWTRLGSDEQLYAKYKTIDPARLNAEQRQAHSNALRNFVLGGADCRVRPRSVTPPSRNGRPRSRKNSAKTRWTPPTPGRWMWTPPNWPACRRT